MSTRLLKAEIIIPLKVFLLLQERISFLLRVFYVFLKKLVVGGNSDHKHTQIILFINIADLLLINTWMLQMRVKITSTSSSEISFLLIIRLQLSLFLLCSFVGVTTCKSVV